MKEISCKLLVIGAGPGGYVCAIRAGQLGVDTVIVEASKPGGTCLNVGCIPSKALIHAADEFEQARRTWPPARTRSASRSTTPVLDLGKTVAWKDGIVGRLTSGVSGLLKKAKVKIVAGLGEIPRRQDRRGRDRDRPAGHPRRDGRDRHRLGAGRTALPAVRRPGDLVDRGAGADRRCRKSLSWSAAAISGSSSAPPSPRWASKVTVVEAKPRILPHYDAELTRPVAKRLAELGIEVLTGAKAKGLAPKATRCSSRPPTARRRRSPPTRSWSPSAASPSPKAGACEELDLDMAGKFIRIDDQCRTSMRGVYAIGDVTGEPMLAHRAMAQGEMVAEIVAGNKRSWDKRCIPAVCFTDPEIVTAGLSPDEARTQRARDQDRAVSRSPPMAAP